MKMIYENSKGVRFEVEHEMDFRDDGTMYNKDGVFAGLENKHAIWFPNMDAAICEMEKWS